MGPIRMTILQPEALDPGEAFTGPGEVRVQFCDSVGKPVGRPRRVAVPPAPVLEAPAPGGAIARVEAAPLLEFRTSLPRGAVGFDLEEDGRGALSATILETASPRPSRPKSIRPFGGGFGARFVLAVLAERYADETGFHADCDSLLAAIRATPPFGEAPDAVGLAALWWNTDPAKGQLGPLQFGTGTDLLFGDQRLSAAFLKKSGVASDRAIVLVNIPRRGGAGGTADFPAWVSNQSSSTDSWQSVAIHELGHALGLGDEYDSFNPDPPPGIEPNISDVADPSGAPWGLRSTVRTPVPTAPFNGGAELPPHTIGTFQGARYEKLDLYRPQFTCMMRSTGAPFCEICRDIIRKKLRP